MKTRSEFRQRWRDASIEDLHRRLEQPISQAELEAVRSVLAQKDRAARSAEAADHKVRDDKIVLFTERQARAIDRSNVIARWALLAAGVAAVCSLLALLR